MRSRVTSEQRFSVLRRSPRDATANFHAGVTGDDDGAVRCAGVAEKRVRQVMVLSRTRRVGNSSRGDVRVLMESCVAGPRVSGAPERYGDTRIAA